MNSQIALIGYSAAAAAFAILTGLLLTIWRDRTRGSVLTIACVVTIVWAIVFALASNRPEITLANVFLAEMIHDCLWLVFLSSLLGGAVASNSNWLVRRGGVALGLALLAAGLLLEYAGLKNLFPGAPGQLLVMGSIGTSLYALVGIEQLYRNARPAQQNGLKFLCLGLAGIFAYDLFLYSNAVVDGQIHALFWGARGFVVALCVPLLAISVKRSPSWRRGIFASRQIVFYTSTLFVAGAYLILIALTGYYIKTMGKEWGDALQLVFLSAAILGIFVLFMSEQLRGRFRVFITKYFFESKYDYRVEWLRLILTLTSADQNLPLKKRAVKALAQIVGSPSGHLWLRNDDAGEYVSIAAWNSQPIVAQIESGAGLPRFLSSQGWVVDIEDLSARTRKYAPLLAADIPGAIAEAAYIVPLIHESELLGFVSLARPKTPTTLNFEDHDLLKTAGQQIAGYLAQEEATERLAENRQFEAYSRFTAFVMHDLKNAIAQQSLIVENAEKHKRNPEFVDDAIETIKGSVIRMRRVMGHLRQGAIDQPTERIDLVKLLLRAESQCSDRRPAPVATVPQDPVYVQANRERLAAALSHAIRNAQDACDGDGKVTLCVQVADGECSIRVEDSGVGMEADFIRDRLFKPFDSTKGAEGMGIGAYQIRETVRASGGDVEVKSEVGVGTTMILRLPVAPESAG